LSASFELQTSDFRLQTSDFRTPAGSPTETLADPERR
jgi:hypothetical protein